MSRQKIDSELELLILNVRCGPFSILVGGDWKWFSGTVSPRTEGFSIPRCLSAFLMLGIVQKLNGWLSRLWRKAEWGGTSTTKLSFPAWVRRGPHQTTVSLGWCFPDAGSSKSLHCSVTAWGSWGKLNVVVTVLICWWCLAPRGLFHLCLLVRLYHQ